MKKFWNFTFEDTPAFIETFDEMPLWSASFGLLMLKHVPLGPYKKVLDIGSGAGFPLLEIAERLGPDVKCYGLDPWKNANERARLKIKNYEANHVEIFEGSADKIPFDNDSVDLIVSNLGINNFDKPAAVFSECFRVLKPGGKLALTTNLNGHWKEFYNVFGQILQGPDESGILEAIKHQQEHRGTTQSIGMLFENAGFRVERCITDNFTMRFLNGTAFLNHHFVKVGWLGSWQAIIPDAKKEMLFTALENALNEYAKQNGELALTVPMAYIEGVK